MAANTRSPENTSGYPDRFCIVVSGLPASGKSTVGAELAQRLQLPLLDKDDYLEGLFETRGCADESTRRRLSRESDMLFQRDVLEQRAAVLVSHWRPHRSGPDSGTPLEWIAESFGRIVELHCDCAVETATHRFATRKRHPGHGDDRRKMDEIQSWFSAYAACLPLSVGTLIAVPSEHEIDYARLQRRIEKVIGGSP